MQQALLPACIRRPLWNFCEFAKLCCLGCLGCRSIYTYTHMVLRSSCGLLAIRGRLGGQTCVSRSWGTPIPNDNPHISITLRYIPTKGGHASCIQPIAYSLHRERDCWLTSGSRPYRCRSTCRGRPQAVRGAASGLEMGNTCMGRSPPLPRPPELHEVPPCPFDARPPVARRPDVRPPAPLTCMRRGPAGSSLQRTRKATATSKLR